jgi:murein DD-endopeptidase MepM/ murein hydrolase activator NlpD
MRSFVDSYWNTPLASSKMWGFPLPTSDPASILENGRSIAGTLDAGRLIQIGPFLTDTSPDTHQGPFREAIDFLVPDGTPVLAAQDGAVSSFIETHTRWGDGEEFQPYTNYVVIAHAPENLELNRIDRIFSQYCHLAAGSVSAQGLKAGMNVRKGQQIGVVGKSGCTDRDHLHFIVFRADRLTHHHNMEQHMYPFKSVAVTFESER